MTRLIMNREKSQGPAAATLYAFNPSSASATRYPSFCNLFAIRKRIVELSSTTRILFPEQFGPAAGAAGGGADAGGDADGVGVAGTGPVVGAVGVGVTVAAAVVDAVGVAETGTPSVLEAAGANAAGAAAGVDVLAGSTVTAGPDGTDAAPSFFMPLATVPAPDGALLAGADGAADVALLAVVDPQALSGRRSAAAMARVLAVFNILAPP